MLPFILKSLRHYWRNHLAVLAGVFLASSVLTGSLLVGDSVKATLRNLAEERNGQVTQALLGNDRFFRQALAEGLGDKATPLLQVPGTVANEQGTTRVNGIDVIGVRSDFGSFAKDGRAWTIQPNRVALNEELARTLAAKVGDTIIVRVELPGVISRDAPLSGESDSTVPMRVEVAKIVTANEFGNFSLKAEQTPPRNLFLPLDFLASNLEKPGRANVALFSAKDSDSLAKAVDERWNADDADLAVAQREGQWDMVTRRVLIDPHAEKTAREIAPDARGVFTYLVNALAANGKSCPYSMVTAIEPMPGEDILPANMPDDGIVVNQWLADDLGLKVGDTLTLTYFVFSPGRKLEEKTHPFQVSRILPMNHPAMHPRWTPEFPGVSEADNCRDWKPGMDIDLQKIRDQDEAYWDQYKGTPKGFISLRTGQEIWRNRFGQLTSLRFGAGFQAADFQAKLDAALKPADFGARLVPVRENSAKAVAKSLDLGMYLSAFSYLLIVAAIILTVLLFIFGIDQRESQIGLLRSLGFAPSKVRSLYLREGGAVALLGALLGILGGAFFTKAMLWAMSGIWQGATGGLRFTFALTPQTALAGAFTTFFVALIAMLLATGRIVKKTPVALLQGGGEAGSAARRSLFSLASFWFVPLCLILAIGSILAGRQSPAVMAGAFAGAGFFLLLAGLMSANVFLRQSGPWLRKSRGLAALGVRNSARRRWRSLAVMIVMAAGVFMIVVTNAFQLDASKDADLRSSGTGGFRFVGDSSLPIYEDLNSPAGREKYGLGEDFQVVSFRVREGEEASCLNLNQAQRPRLIAVDSKSLADRQAFTFQIHAWEGEGSPWQVLDRKFDDGAIPGVMDLNSATYALKIKAGDIVTYADGQGRPLRVRIVGLLKSSLLQGNVIISQANFDNAYTSGGYRFFLVDADASKAAKVGKDLTRMLEQQGLSLQSAADRLQTFHTVQNTFLRMFTTLGGLGLLLGTVGLAIIVFRNILERRRELALMEAVGFTRQRLSWLVLSEHWFLHLSAVILGASTAFLAIYPAVKQSGQDVPVRALAILIAAILVAGLFFCWFAARGILRRPLMEALRHE